MKMISDKKEDAMKDKDFQTDRKEINEEKSPPTNANKYTWKLSEKSRGGAMQVLGNAPGPCTFPPFIV